MSYLVFARKYRPQTFDDVIGQTHITDILKKAVTSDRLSHAYLFCGPRGVGKTSCARILAKSVNCVNGPTLTPCGVCPACDEIAKGNSFDVLEIDGASNRGIDEIRALRENVKFAPSYGRYKIYIVDEVHMLTPEAFNALLKTLEEPPEYVKFIFATTEPNKVPATIISRCQKFDFKRVSAKQIAGFLDATSKKEKLQVETDALYAVAKAAQGSLRDALSILDQLSSLSERTIQPDDVYSMLGLVETEYRFNLVDAIGQKDCAAALAVVGKIVDKGKDIKQLVKDLTEHLRDMMVIKIGGKDLEHLVDYPAAIKEMYWKQAQNFTLPEILKAIDAFIEAQDISRITETIRLPLELALAKLTYKEEDRDQTADPPSLKKTGPLGNVIFKQAKPLRNPAVKPPSRLLNDQKGEAVVCNSGQQPEDKNFVKKENSEGQDRISMKNTELNLERLNEIWENLTYAVSREKMSVATYLQEGRPHEFNNDRLTIAFPVNCSFNKECLESPENIKIVERIFESNLKCRLSVKYVLVKDLQPAKEDPSIKIALDTFGGEVVEKWHEE